MKSKKEPLILPNTNILNKSEALIPLVAQGIVAGKTQDELALELQTSQPNISRIVNREDCKAMIEEQTRVLLSKLPNVISLIHSDIDLSNKIADYFAGRTSIWPVNGLIEPKDLLSLYNSTYKKAQDLLKSSGILPGATSSVVISQVFHADKLTVLTPMAQRMVDKFTESLALDSEEVIEAECKDITGKAGNDK